MAPNFNERIRPVDPERFRFALGVFQAAAAMKGPFPNPQNFSLHIVDDDRTANTISFTDIPENRGMIAIKKEFPDPEEFQCIGFRILTFSEVIKNDKLVSMGLIRMDEHGQTEVHDSVILALAQAPFRKSGALDKKAFIELVKYERQKNSSRRNAGNVRRAEQNKAHADQPNLVSATAR